MSDNLDNAKLEIENVKEILKCTKVELESKI